MKTHVLSYRLNIVVTKPQRGGLEEKNTVGARIELATGYFVGTLIQVY